VQTYTQLLPGTLELGLWTRNLLDQDFVPVQVLVRPQSWSTLWTDGLG